MTKCGENGNALVINPVPELLGAKRLFANRGHFPGKLFARQPDQIALAIGEQIARRRKRGGLGKDAFAIGGSQLRVENSF